MLFWGIAIKNLHSFDIVGDMHNVDSLRNILAKCTNIISLGDIGAAVPKQIFLNGQLQRYRNAWKAFSKKESNSSREDLEWFRDINVSSWKTQISSIVGSGKDFVLIQGNSDKAMINFFPECRNALQSDSSRIKFSDSVKLMMQDNVQLLLLPFQKEEYDLSNVLALIDKQKKLIVLSHCPPMSNSGKEYYLNVYVALDKISGNHKNVILIHGHMHPSLSYTYKPEGLPDVVCYCPKAEETFDGFGINNHFIRLDTLMGKIVLIDSVNGEKCNFQQLPDKYRKNPDHWNEFDENGNANKRV